MSMMKANMSTYRAGISGDCLTYVERSFPNVFRFEVRELPLDQIRSATLKRSVLGCRLEVLKLDGRKLWVRGLEQEEAIGMAGCITDRANGVASSEVHGAPRVQGCLSSFEENLAEIFSDGATCISRLADMIIQQAIGLNASDIHFEPLENLRIRYRIDGVLIDAAEIPAAYHQRIVSRIKVLAKLPTYERDIPLDGRIEKDYGRGLDLRVSTFPTIRGDKVVIRIFDSGRHLYRLNELGFEPAVLEKFESLVLAPEGTVILTGPSNSGKTTTIYSVLESIHEVKRNTVNIATIEDPVERDLRKFSQTQIAPARGLTFHSALRSVLRQDPNVIVIGEIRDTDTAGTAIRAGMTGHLVITTIHSATAAGAFARLMEMGIEPFVLASSVTGIMAQRLVRKVCPNCGETVELPADILRRFKVEAELSEQRKGRGCPYCAGTGYKGRTAIAELLLMNDSLRKAVLARLSVVELKKVAGMSGMRSLLQDGLEKVRAGITNVEELARVLVPEEV